jgi:hypothetical protein
MSTVVTRCEQRRGRWSAVECKRCRRLPRRPLQRPADPKALLCSRPPLRAGVIRPHHVTRRSGRRSARLEPTDGGTARAQPVSARYSPFAIRYSLPLQSPLTRLFPHAAVYPGLARCARFGRGYFQSPLRGSPNGNHQGYPLPASVLSVSLWPLLPAAQRCEPQPVSARYSPFAIRYSLPRQSPRRGSPDAALRLMPSSSCCPLPVARPVPLPVARCLAESPFAIR